MPLIFNPKPRQKLPTYSYWPTLTIFGMRGTALVLIIVGISVILLGILAYAGWLNWFGKLPGDIRFDSGNTRIYIPWVSMLLISVVLSLILYLVRRS
jgi:uncharacterized membrane protein